MTSKYKKYQSKREGIILLTRSHINNNTHCPQTTNIDKVKDLAWIF